MRMVYTGDLCTKGGIAMNLTVNGEARSASTGTTLEAFLTELGVDPRKVAVERNREIVPKSLFADVMLAEDDMIEIVQFVGGG